MGIPVRRRRLQTMVTCPHCGSKLHVRTADTKYKAKLRAEHRCTTCTRPLAPSDIGTYVSCSGCRDNAKERSKRRWKDYIAERRRQLEIAKGDPYVE